MVAPVVEGTAVVWTVKVTEVIPAGIVMVAGTVAAGMLLERETTRPPAGAGDWIVSVPVLG
jgi:hypothetical protein